MPLFAFERFYAATQTIGGTDRRFEESLLP
jgi:hypothetical protein